MLVASIIQRFGVDIEKKIGRSISKGLSGGIGQVMAFTAGVTPVILYPKAAYGEQQIAYRNQLSDILSSKSQEDIMAAISDMKKNEVRKGAGLDSLRGNIDYIFRELMAGTMKLIPQAREEAPKAIEAAPHTGLAPPAATQPLTQPATQTAMQAITAIPADRKAAQDILKPFLGASINTMHSLICPQSGLPMDKARIVDGRMEVVSTFTSPSNIASALETFVVASKSADPQERAGARAAIMKILNTLSRLDTFKYVKDGVEINSGLFFSWYRAGEEKPSASDKYVPTFDNMNLTVALKIIVEAYKDDRSVSRLASDIMSKQDYSPVIGANNFLAIGLTTEGKVVNNNIAIFGNEARSAITILGAMGMLRKDGLDIKVQPPVIIEYELQSGEVIPILATWDGSAFQMLVPNALLAEDANMADGSESNMKILLGNYQRAVEDVGKRRHILGEGANVAASYSACQTGEGAHDYSGIQGNIVFAQNPEAVREQTRRESHIPVYSLFLNGTVDPKFTVSQLLALKRAGMADALYSQTTGFVNSFAALDYAPTGDRAVPVIPMKLSLDEGCTAISLAKILDPENMGLASYLRRSDIGPNIQNMLAGQNEMLAKAMEAERVNGGLRRAGMLADGAADDVKAGNVEAAREKMNKAIITLSGIEESADAARITALRLRIAGVEAQCKQLEEAKKREAESKAEIKQAFDTSGLLLRKVEEELNSLKIDEASRDIEELSSILSGLTTRYMLNEPVDGDALSDLQTKILNRMSWRRDIRERYEKERISVAEAQGMMRDFMQREKRELDAINGERIRREEAARAGRETLPPVRADVIKAQQQKLVAEINALTAQDLGEKALGTVMRDAKEGLIDIVRAWNIKYGTISDDDIAVILDKALDILARASKGDNLTVASLIESRSKEFKEAVVKAIADMPESRKADMSAFSDILKKSGWIDTYHIVFRPKEGIITPETVKIERGYQAQGVVYSNLDRATLIKLALYYQNTTIAQRKEWGDPVEKWWQYSTEADRQDPAGFRNYINKSIKIWIEDTNGKIIELEDGIKINLRLGASLLRGPYIGFTIDIPIFNSSRVPRENLQTVNKHSVKLAEMQNYANMIFTVENAIAAVQMAERRAQQTREELYGVKEPEREIAGAEDVLRQARESKGAGYEDRVRSAEISLERARLTYNQALDDRIKAQKQLMGLIGLRTGIDRITLNDDLLREDITSEKSRQEIEVILQALGMPFTSQTEKTLLADSARTQETLARAAMELMRTKGDTRVNLFLNPEYCAVLGYGSSSVLLQLSSEERENPERLWLIYWTQALNYMQTLDNSERYIGALQTRLTNARMRFERFDAMLSDGGKAYFKMQWDDYPNGLASYAEIELARRDLIIIANERAKALQEYKRVYDEILKRSVGVEERVRAILDDYNQKVREGKRIYAENKHNERDLVATMGARTFEVTNPRAGDAAYRAALRFEQELRAEYDKAAKEAKVGFLRTKFTHSFLKANGTEQQIECNRDWKKKLESLRARLLYASNAREMLKPVVTEKLDNLTLERMISLARQNNFSVAQARSLSEAAHMHYLDQMRDAERAVGGNRVRIPRFRAGWSIGGGLPVDFDVEVKRDDQAKLVLYGLDWKLAEQGVDAASNDVAEQLAISYVDLCKTQAFLYNWDKSIIELEHLYAQTGEKVIAEFKRNNIPTQKLEELLVKVKDAHERLSNAYGREDCTKFFDEWDRLSVEFMNATLAEDKKLGFHLSAVKELLRIYNDYQFSMIIRNTYISQRSEAEENLKRVLGLGKDQKINIPFLSRLKDMDPDTMSKLIAEEVSKIVGANYNADAYARGARLMAEIGNQVLVLAKQGKNPKFTLSFTFSSTPSAGIGTNLWEGAVSRGKAIDVAMAQANRDLVVNRRRTLAVNLSNDRSRNNQYVLFARNMLAISMNNLATAQRSVDEYTREFGPGGTERVLFSDVLKTLIEKHSHRGEAIARAFDVVSAQIYSAESGTLGGEFKSAVQTFADSMSAPRYLNEDARIKSGQALGIRRLEDLFVVAKNLDVWAGAGVSVTESGSGGGGSAPYIQPGVPVIHPFAAVVNSNVTPLPSSESGKSPGTTSKETTSTSGGQAGGGATRSIQASVAVGASYLLNFLDNDIAIADRVVEQSTYQITEADLALRRKLISFVYGELLPSAYEVQEADENLARARDYQATLEARIGATALHNIGDQEGVRGARYLVSVSNRELETANNNYNSAVVRIQNLLRTTNAHLPIFGGRVMSQKEKQEADKSEREAYNAYLKERKAAQKRQGQLFSGLFHGEEIHEFEYPDGRIEKIKVRKGDKVKLDQLKQKWLQLRWDGFAGQVSLPAFDNFLTIALKRDPTLQSIRAEDAIVLLRKSSLGGENFWGRLIPKGREGDAHLAISGTAGWNVTPDIGFEYTFRLVGNTEKLKVLREELRHRIIAQRGEQRWLEVQNEIDMAIDRINNSARDYVDSHMRAQLALKELNQRWDEYKRSPGKILWSEVFKIQEDVKSPEAEYRVSLSILNRSRAEHKTAVEDFAEIIRALGIDEGNVFERPTFEKMAEHPIPVFERQESGTIRTDAARQEIEARRERIKSGTYQVGQLELVNISDRIVGLVSSFFGARQAECARAVNLPENWSEAALEVRIHRPVPDLTAMPGARKNIKTLWDSLKTLRDATRQSGAIGRTDPSRDIVNLDDMTWFIVNQRIACNRAGSPKTSIDEDVRIMSILAPHIVAKMNAFFEDTSRAMIEKYVREKMGKDAADKLTAEELKVITDYILIEIKDKYGVEVSDNLPSIRPAIDPALAAPIKDSNIQDALLLLRNKFVLDPFLRITYEGLLDETERSALGLNTLSTLGVIGYYRGKMREALMPDGWVDTEIAKDPTTSGVKKLLTDRLDKYPGIDGGIKQRINVLIAKFDKSQVLDEATLKEARELLAQAYVLQSIGNDLDILTTGWKMYFTDTQKWIGGGMEDDKQLRKSYSDLLRSFKYNVWTYEFNGMLDVAYWNMISRNYRDLAAKVWPEEKMFLYGDLWSRGRLISLAQMLITNDFTRDPNGATLEPVPRAVEFIGFADKLREPIDNFSADAYEVEFNNIANTLVISKGERAGQVMIVEDSFNRLLAHIEKGVRQNLAGMVRIDFSELERLAGMCRRNMNTGTITEQDKIALVVEAKNIMDQIKAGRMLSTAAFLSACIPDMCRLPS